MFHFTAHFQFPDGAIALASVSVAAPEDAAVVQYAGDTDRLPGRFAESEVSTLRVWSKRIARETGATLSITETGQFDTWSE